MKNNSKGLMTFLCLWLVCESFTAANADELSDYVAQCKSELGFDAIPQFSCIGDNFRPRTTNKYVTYGSFPERRFSQTNDFVAHKNINTNVDAIFACRWVLDQSTTDRGAASAEMIVHNRSNGKTCFFEGKTNLVNGATPEHVPTTDPVSPSDTNAGNFWEQPSNMRVCTDCHSAGPYIASPEILSSLAKFGLINDGHDIQGKKYSAVLFPAEIRAQAMLKLVLGSSYQFDGRLNSILYKRNQPAVSSLARCASNCHLVGGYSPEAGVVANVDSLVLPAIILPSINMVIDDLTHNNEMAPQKNSDYYSINRDTPYGTGDQTGDHEYLSEARKAFPDLKICVDPITSLTQDPISIETHIVDSSIVIRANKNGIVAAKKLSKFNLYDGLVCKDSDNPADHFGGCWNWQTRYKCGNDWTDWLDADTDLDGTQNESRANYEKAYNSLHVKDKKTFCSNPTYIQARYQLPTTGVQYSDPLYGPRDRLRQFNNTGLRCYNEDQPNKQCHNYVVKFICP